MLLLLLLRYHLNRHHHDQYCYLSSAFWTFQEIKKDFDVHSISRRTQHGAVHGFKVFSHEGLIFCLLLGDMLCRTGIKVWGLDLFFCLWMTCYAKYQSAGQSWKLAGHKIIILNFFLFSTIFKGTELLYCILFYFIALHCIALHCIVSYCFVLHGIELYGTSQYYCIAIIVEC